MEGVPEPSETGRPRSHTAPDQGRPNRDGSPDNPGSAQHRGERLLAAIRRSRMLGRLSADDLPAVLASSRIVRGGPNARVLRRTDDAVVILLTGAAKEHASNLEGFDVVLRVLGPGDTAGLTGVMALDGRANVTAIEESEALLIEGSDLRKLAGRNPDLARGWADTTTRQLADMRQELILFAATSTAERVIHRLVELTDRWGVPGEQGVSVSAHLTQEELASWAGASRESTARVLQSLRRAGILTTSRRTLVVHEPDQLRRRAGTTLDLTVTEAMPILR